MAMDSQAKLNLLAWLKTFQWGIVCKLANHSGGSVLGQKTVTARAFACTGEFEQLPEAISHPSGSPANCRQAGFNPKARSRLSDARSDSQT